MNHAPPVIGVLSVTLASCPASAHFWRGVLIHSSLGAALFLGGYFCLGEALCSGSGANLLPIMPRGSHLCLEGHRA